VTNFKVLFKYSNTPLSEIISVINANDAKIALIIDDDGKLIGTITDGDIRRGLLRGENLTTQAEKVMKREFRSVHSSASEEIALSFMLQEMLQQVPALNEEGHVVKIHLLEEFIKPKSLPNVAVLMAGGFGQRLGSLTADSPKPMLKVGGKPMLEIVLRQCINYGLSKFYISVNYHKKQIMDYFSNGSRWNVKIEYIEEIQPLGTIGSLRLLPKIPENPLLIMNGDVLTRVNLNSLFRFHNEQCSEATLCIREHETHLPFGVVNFNGSRVSGLIEKPLLKHYINAGVYIIDPLLLDLIPKKGSFDMPELLNEAIKHKKSIHAFPIHEYWLDVGHPETFEQANGEWS